VNVEGGTRDVEGGTRDVEGGSRDVNVEGERDRERDRISRSLVLLFSCLLVLLSSCLLVLLSSCPLVFLFSFNSFYSLPPLPHFFSSFLHFFRENVSYFIAFSLNLSN